jgi:hypothetical protein
MPIEPPDPHELTATLRVVLDALAKRIEGDPGDVRAIVAMSHVAGAIAALEPSEKRPSSRP